jgi:linoleoyl-CoA desaturase
MSKVIFSRENLDFSKTLKQRVDEYFKSNSLNFSGNSSLYSKTIILVSLAIACYVTLVFVAVPVWAAIVTCVVLGLTLAAIGFNVMHDGGHGSYSTKPWLNELMVFSLNLMGGNAYLWKQKHNVAHHNFTNIDGMDDDIDLEPLLRVHEHQTLRSYHRFQHFYAAILYAFTYLAWVFFLDFKKYFTGKISTLTFKKMDRKEHIIFWASKLFYVFTFIVIPIYTIGWAHALIGYAITSFVCGFVISVVFQLAHIVEHSSFPVPDTAHKLQNNWDVHQLLTTVNFATKSKGVSWFVGGLNFQVEHHLFPKISHIHYPAISEIVKNTCKEFRIPYNEYETVMDAINSHVRYLKTAGRTLVVPTAGGMIPA